MVDKNKHAQIKKALTPFVKPGVTIGFKDYGDWETIALICEDEGVVTLTANSDYVAWFDLDSELPEDFFRIEEEIVLTNGHNGRMREANERHELSSKLSIMDISRKLPGVAKEDGDGEKVRNEWLFTYKDQNCRIYDWKGSRWTAIGPAWVFEELGFMVG